MFCSLTLATFTIIAVFHDRPRLLLTNVHLLYALIHDYEELVQLFLHPALLKLFCAEEDEVEAAKETRENSSRDRSIIAGDEESSRSRATSKVTFSLSHGLVIMVKHYLDVLDVLTVDHYLFSASQVGVGSSHELKPL